ncbi:MAG: sigma-E processing peptidase SpoIIGA [Eubacteriaceae bacterium]|nr:sigma-E processing peptidase SpoIIGA [Eubacteriaceae bacterium]
MRYVYGEELFAMNFACNLILALSAYKARRIKIVWARACLGALVGVAYMFLVVANRFYATAFWKLAALVLMALCITPHIALRELVINSALMLVSSFSAAGCVLALSMVASTSLAAGFGPASYITSVLGAALGAFATITVYRKSFLSLEGAKYSTFNIKSEGRSIRAVLFDDSGNLAKTPFGASISVLEEKSFLELSGASCSSVGGYAEFASFVHEVPDERKSRFSVTKLSGVGTESYRLVYKADLAAINGQYILAPAYFCGAPLPGSWEYDGVCNIRLILERCVYESSQSAN